jgi:hypothetical protein
MPNDDQRGFTPHEPASPDMMAYREAAEANRTGEASKELGSSRTPAIIAAVVAIVILAALIVIGVLLFNNPPVAAVLRDIFIILLGIETMIIGLLMIIAVVAMIYVALKVYDLVQFVQNELRPVMHRADDTVRTVQSRVTYISDAAVKPAINLAAGLAAIRQTIKALRR